MDIQKCGWKILNNGRECKVEPVWFTGEQLPPSLRRKRKDRGKRRRNVDSCDGDDELPSEITAPLRKIQKITNMSYFCNKYLIRQAPI